MAINFPGPYELRIFYTSSDLTPGGRKQHVQRLNIDLDEPATQNADFDTYTLIDRLGASFALDEVVEDWLTVIAARFPTTTTFDLVELWKYPTPESFESVFWAAYSPVVDQGSSGSSAVQGGQAIYTFRTQEGGIMKVSLMEDVSVPGQRVPSSLATGAVAAVFDFILNGGTGYSGPFLARDTSYPIAGIAFYPGQNEKIWKSRYRTGV